MDELDYRGQFETSWPVEAHGPSEEQYQARSDPLASGADDVGGDPVDQGDVRGQALTYDLIDEAFLDELCGYREYQKEAIRTTLPSKFSMQMETAPLNATSA